MLPGPRVFALVAFECVDASHEESAFAVRSQAHIHLVEPTRRRMHREEMHDTLPQSQEKDSVVERTRGRSLLDFAARIVQKDQIEIGAISELQPSQLAVAGNGDSHWPPLRIAAAVWDAVDLRHLLPREIHAALNYQFRNVGQPIAHLHERQPPREVCKRHFEYRRFLKLPQRLHLPLGIVGGQPFGACGELLRKILA
jgi:hypothetical protein